MIKSNTFYSSTDFKISPNRIWYNFDFVENPLFDEVIRVGGYFEPEDLIYMVTWNYGKKYHIIIHKQIT